MRSSEAKAIDYLSMKFREPTWDMYTVKLAVSAKQANRNLKGEPFNCFVLARDSDREKDELANFLTSLKQNMDAGNFSTPTRFQLAVCEKKHWTAFDILVKNDQLNVLCLDAANDSKDEATLKTILDKFPNRNAYRFDAEKLSNDKRARIQSDNNSCSRMSLDHIFRLSKLDIFEELDAQKQTMEMQPIKNLGKANFNEEEKFEKFREDKESSHVKVLTLKIIAKIAPKIVATTQSWSTLNNIDDQDIKIRAERHSITDSDKKKINKTIDYKADKMFQRVLHHYEKLTISAIDGLLKNQDAIRDKFISCTDNERQQLIKNQISHPSIINIIDSEISTIKNQIIDNANVRKMVMEFKNELFELSGNKSNLKPEYFKNEEKRIQGEIAKLAGSSNKDYPELMSELHQLNDFKKFLQISPISDLEQKVGELQDNPTIHIPDNSRSSISQFYNENKNSESPNINAVSEHIEFNFKDDEVIDQHVKFDYKEDSNNELEHSDHIQFDFQNDETDSLGSSESTSKNLSNDEDAILQMIGDLPSKSDKYFQDIPYKANSKDVVSAFNNASQKQSQEEEQTENVQNVQSVRISS